MRYDLQLETLIDSRSSGKSLLEAISERFSYHPHQFWQEKISLGQVTINKEPAHAGQILAEDDLLSFIIPNFEEPDIDTDYQTVWRNDYLLLVNKPAGLPVHSTRRFYFQTLIAEIRRREGFSDINPLQRLDRETSGLMFLSQTSRVPHRFHKNFKKYLKAKFYLGLVRGNFSWDRIKVSQPLKECKVPPVRYKMIVAPDGKEAESEFFCLGSREGQSLLLIRLETGRKHQIRAHLEFLGFPLIGEKLYYDDASYFLKRCDDNLTETDLDELGASNHLLHAYALITEFPDYGRRIFLANPTSAEFSRYLESFTDWQSETEKIIGQF